MNVRFFAGTRADYDSLPVPRNPLGLYFCEDTQELFWADRLLTDGMRVVSTMADLPTPDKAADGVVYYVTETRNGYVVPHGSLRWVQTIYAPVSNIDDIPVSEINNTAATVGAVRDIKYKLYGAISELDERISAITGIDLSAYAKKTDLAGLATESYVKEQLKSIPEVNLDGYATEAWVCEQEFAKRTDIPDISNFATIDDVAAVQQQSAKNEVKILALDSDLFDVKEQIENIPTADLTGYATEEYVDNKVAGVEVPTKVSELDNDAGYVTDRNIFYISSIDTDITESEKVLLNKIENNEEVIVYFVGNNDNTIEPATYITKTTNHISIEKHSKAVQTPDAGYIVDVKTVFDYIKQDDGNWKLEISFPADTAVYPSKSQFEELKEQVDAIDIPETDLSNYYNKSETGDLIDDAISSIIIPDTSNFITIEDVEEKGYITEHQDLSDYAKKSDIKEVDLTGYATESFVIAKIAEAELADKDIDVSGLATENFVLNEIAKIELPEIPANVSEFANDAGYLTEHQDLSEYAKTSTVIKHKYEVLPFEGAIINYADNEVRVNTQHVDIGSLPVQEAGDGSSSSYYYMTFRAYAPEGATSVVEGQSDKMDADHSELTVDKYGRQYTTIWAAIAMKSGSTWIKYGDMSNVGDRVGKYLGFYYNFHWYAGDKLIGMDKVRVILTNDSCHNDLVPDAIARRIEEKVAAITIPSTDSFATKEYVDEAIANVEIPETSLENYYTKEETTTAINDAIASVSIPGASNIPFTTHKYVRNVVGGFELGESVCGMTVAELFAKLLELSDEPPSVVDEILAHKYDMYHFNDDLKVEKIEYSNTIFKSEDEYNNEPTESTFYQYTYTDENGKEVTEYGYQHYNLGCDYIYYMIMLPSSLVIGDNVKVKTWRESGEGKWHDDAREFECDSEVIATKFAEDGLEMPEIPDGYTMWVDFNDINTGAQFRYIITE